MPDRATTQITFNNNHAFWFRVCFFVFFSQTFSSTKILVLCARSPSCLQILGRYCSGLRIALFHYIYMLRALYASNHRFIILTVFTNGACKPWCLHETQYEYQMNWFFSTGIEILSTSTSGSVQSQSVSDCWIAQDIFSK